MGGASRFSLFRKPRRLSIAALAAAATFLAAVPVFPATPSRQGRMVPPENRPYRGHPPRLPKTPPPPSQAEITKVIDENRSTITVCYWRALARDNGLTDGKIAVKLSIGISGRVKHVSVDGPVRFRSLLEPCIREAVSRWIFPQASEEYGTEFPFVFQNDHDVEEAGDGCSISVNTVPWSEIWIDGKNTTRHTPVVGWKLACGKHKLGFKRPDMDIDQTESIRVVPGKRFRQRYTLTADD